MPPNTPPPAMTTYPERPITPPATCRTWRHMPASAETMRPAPAMPASRPKRGRKVTMPPYVSVMSMASAA
ncbi:hypothetical protein, partial [Hydrogenibacillus schlegelii]|uniref:hypothetical protein n=1 Tax=Hydrogenibacillus schlegelii TaxID=1484 RepID=UPI0034A06154